MQFFDHDSIELIQVMMKVVVMFFSSHDDDDSNELAEVDLNQVDFLETP